MEPTFFAQYRGFEFHCSPERLNDRSYAPRLVVHDTHDRSTREIEVDATVAPYSDPTAAAHRAFAFGRRWVDGGEPKLPRAASPDSIYEMPG